MDSRYNYEPFNRNVISVGNINRAQKVSDILHLLCFKANGDPLTCCSCPDSLNKQCTVGEKIKELLEKETRPDENKEETVVKPQTVAKPQDSLSGKNDPDYAVFVAAVESGFPVQWYVKHGYDLRSKPKPANNIFRAAYDFLKMFEEKYPDVKTAISLEEALTNEQKSEYESALRKIRAGLGESKVAEDICRRYNMKFQEASNYLEELQAGFGRFEDAVKFAAKPARNNFSATEIDINEAYESLNDRLAVKEEDYSAREDELNEQYDLVTEYIDYLNGVVRKIKEYEEKLARYPVIDVVSHGVESGEEYEEEDMEEEEDE